MKFALLVVVIPLLMVLLIIETLVLMRRRITGKLYAPIRSHVEINAELQDIYIDLDGSWSHCPDNLKEEYINVWYSNKYRNACTMLYFHGNAFNISYREYMVKMCDLLRMNILLVDYRGYGKSSGKPSSQKVLQDAKVAMKFLLHYMPANMIYVWGESLGGSPACYVTSKYPNVAGLILFSTFSSFHGILQTKDPKWWLIYSIARGITNDIDECTNNVSMLSKARCPILILHSRQDTLIPYHNAEILMRAVPHDTKELVTIYGEHDDPEVTRSNIRKILHFLGVNHSSDKHLVTQIRNVINGITW